MDNISIDVLRAIDMRIGTIIAAELIPGSDKLIKLTINLGEDSPRQIIAGIKPYVDDVSRLVGIQCPVVANLEKKIIRGLESNGMLLAASHSDGSFSLLRTAHEIPPGSVVK